MKRRTYFGLTLLLGPITYLYKPKPPKRYLWVMFISSLLTLGILYVLVYWPLAIIRSLKIKSDDLKELRFIDPFSKLPLGHRVLSWFAVVAHSLLGALIIGYLALLVAFYHLGPSTPGTPELLESQLIHTTALYLILFTVVFMHLISVKTSDGLVKRFKIMFLLFVCLAIVPTSIYGVSTRLSGKECSIEDTYRNSLNSIVPIETEKGYGTGFVVDRSGKVVTAHHVIKDAGHLNLGFVNDSRQMRVIATAPEYDLALLSVDGGFNSELKLDQLYNNVDEVMVVGWPSNAFDAGRSSVSKGIISRVLDTGDLGLNNTYSKYLEIIQTDAAINPGNSGSPLIGDCGAVGVVVSVSDVHGLRDYGLNSEQGIGYAVSSYTLSQVFGL